MKFTIFIKLKHENSCYSNTKFIYFTEHIQALRTVFFSHDHYICHSNCLFSNCLKVKETVKKTIQKQLG